MYYSQMEHNAAKCQKLVPIVLTITRTLSPLNGDRWVPLPDRQRHPSDYRAVVVFLGDRLRGVLAVSVVPAALSLALRGLGTGATGTT